MGARVNLQRILENILGTRNVYYQPPATIRMSYPAIVYSRSRISRRNANNGLYTQLNAYDLTVIDPNPDSDIVGKIAKLPYCSHSRHYVSDNLNHDAFTIYY